MTPYRSRALGRILLGSISGHSVLHRCRGPVPDPHDRERGLAGNRRAHPVAVDLRVLAFAGSQQGVGFPYQQWYLAAGLGYQWKRVSSHHHRNIDSDKEHLFVFGGGYEFLRTIKSAKTSDNRRLLLDGTSGFRLPAEFLVRDRNRVELRWIRRVLDNYGTGSPPSETFWPTDSVSIPTVLRSSSITAPRIPGIRNGTAPALPCADASCDDLRRGLRATPSSTE